MGPHGVQDSHRTFRENFPGPGPPRDRPQPKEELADAQVGHVRGRQGPTLGGIGGRSRRGRGALGPLSAVAGIPAGRPFVFFVSSASGRGGVRQRQRRRRRRRRWEAGRSEDNESRAGRGARLRDGAPGAVPEQGSSANRRRAAAAAAAAAREGGERDRRPPLLLLLLSPFLALDVGPSLGRARAVDGCCCGGGGDYTGVLRRPLGEVC